MPRRSGKSAPRNPKSAVTSAGWARIRLFAMDVDGVLTDGTVSIASDGTESKRFSILDGMGLRQLILAGVHVAWISGRASGATAVRAKELGIPHVVQGRTDKLEALLDLAIQLNLAPEQCVYMGDDVIDVPAMEWAGIGASVATAMPAALAAAAVVPRRPAGHGAVREICDLILAARAPARRK